MLLRLLSGQLEKTSTLYLNTSGTERKQRSPYVSRRKKHDPPTRSNKERRVMPYISQDRREQLEPGIQNTVKHFRTLDENGQDYYKINHLWYALAYYHHKTDLYDKSLLGHRLADLPDGPTQGDKNYVITEIVMRYFDLANTRYDKIDRAIRFLVDLEKCVALLDKGTVRCVQMEIYRRAAVPYENKKIEENSDIPSFSCLEKS